MRYDIMTDTKVCLVDNGKLRASAHQMSVLVEDERHQSEHTSNKGENKTGILAADVVEELRSEERRDGTKSVSHETLTGNG